jgi:hypothetical protein
MKPTPGELAVVARLWEAQRLRGLPWEPTTEPGEYRLVLNEGLFRIGVRNGAHARTADGDVATTVYSLVVIDKRGAFLLRHDAEYDRSEFPLLAQLYEGVSRGHNETAMAGLIRELDDIVREAQLPESLKAGSGSQGGEK